MLRTKSCPRCKGDVFRDEDRYGRFEVCLQCGYLGDVASTVFAIQKEQFEARGAAWTVWPSRAETVRPAALLASVF